MCGMCLAARAFAPIAQGLATPNEALIGVEGIRAQARHRGPDQESAMIADFAPLDGFPPSGRYEA